MTTFQKNILVTGYSGGAGKSFLITQKIIPTAPIFQSSVSHATREPRGAEKNGKEYHFIKPLKFEKMILQRSFLEYTNPAKDIYYGSSVAEYKKARKAEKFLAFDVDYKGFEQLTAPNSILKNQLVTVLLLTPVWQRIAWMQKRGDMTNESIIKRVSYSDKVERPFFEKNKTSFDFVLEDYTESTKVDFFANQIVNACVNQDS